MVELLDELASDPDDKHVMMTTMMMMMMMRMMRMMKILKQRVALWQVSAISIVSRGGNKKGVSITPIVIADHRCDGRHD